MMTPRIGASRTWLTSVSLVVLALLYLGGCEHLAAPAAPTDGLITVLDGTGQVAEFGTTLAPIYFQVSDADGVLPGVTVTFTTADGGTMTPTSQVSDDNGIVKTVWTLGPAIGTQTLTAALANFQKSVVTAVAVNGTPGAASAFVLVSGDLQLGLPGATLAQPLVVAVTDNHGIGVPGVSVTFTSGGDSQIDSGTAGAQPVTTSRTLLTNAAGQAAIQYKFGSEPGAYEVNAQATVAGTAMNVLFSPMALNGPDQAGYASVIVGRVPQGVSVDIATDKVYVANSLANVACDFGPSPSGTGTPSFTRINPDSNFATQTFRTGTTPIYATPNPKTNTIFVAGSPSLEIWNGNTNTNITTLSSLGVLRQAAINTTTNEVWTNASDQGSAVLISGATNQVVTTVSTGHRGPNGIAVNGNTNMVYTADSPDSTVTVINGATHAVVTHIPVGGAAIGIAVNSLTNMVYVSTGGYLASLVAINGATNQVVATIPANRRLGDMSIDSTRNRIYVVSGTLPYSVAVFDGVQNRLIGFHPVGQCPGGVAINPVTQLLYVSSLVDNLVLVLNATLVP